MKHLACVLVLLLYATVAIAPFEWWRTEQADKYMAYERQRMLRAALWSLSPSDAAYGFTCKDSDAIFCFEHDGSVWLTGVHIVGVRSLHVEGVEGTCIIGRVNGKWQRQGDCMKVNGLPFDDFLAKYGAKP